MRAAVARRHRRDSNHCERSPRESVTLATRSRYLCEPEILSPLEKSPNSPVGKLYTQRSWTPAPACSDHGPGQTTPSVVIGERHEELALARAMQHHATVHLVSELGMPQWAQQSLTAAGSEPTPFRTGALDHSAKVSCCVGTRARIYINLETGMTSRIAGSG